MRLGDERVLALGSGGGRQERLPGWLTPCLTGAVLKLNEPGEAIMRDAANEEWPTTLRFSRRIGEAIPDATYACALEGPRPGRVLTWLRGASRRLDESEYGLRPGPVIGLPASDGISPGDARVNAAAAGSTASTLVQLNAIFARLVSWLLAAPRPRPRGRAGSA